jgi:uncharacterized protein (TIGR03067 family)
VVRAFWLSVAVVLLVGSQDDKNAATKEVSRFEGVWRFALVEVEGVKQAEAPFETNKIIIRGDGAYVVVQGQRITRGQFKVDPTKTPKHFDVTITDGPAKGRRFSAIYELEGDTYRFCGSLRSKDRPSALESEPGSGTILQVLKREKQTVDEALTALARQELAGTWQALSSIVDGKKATVDDTNASTLSFEAPDKTTVIRNSMIVLGATTKIDGAAKPMTIDLTWTIGENEGQEALGIFRIEDGLLTICLGAAGKVRPREFSCEPGSGNRLATYERVKNTERRKGR